jgi:hypothetical protein
MEIEMVGRIWVFVCGLRVKIAYSKLVLIKDSQHFVRNRSIAPIFHGGN